MIATLSTTMMTASRMDAFTYANTQSARPCPAKTGDKVSCRSWSAKLISRFF